MITPPVSPPPEQITAEQNTEKPKDTTENDSEQSTTGQNESNEDYIVSHSNGTAMKTFLPSKPQTSQHKFLAAGQKKSLSSSNLFAVKKGSPECSNDQVSRETGDENTLPDVKVDQGNEIDNMDNLFNV